MGEGLEELRDADGEGAVTLDFCERGDGDGTGHGGEMERAGEDVGGGDCVLNGDIDADAADGGHGVGGVADAEHAGCVPAMQVVDLHGEELELIEGGDFVDA